MSSCEADLKTEVISCFFPVTIGCKETKPGCNIIKVCQTKHFCHKRKRNLISKVNKKLNRKQIHNKNTTCTPFFVQRTTAKNQMPSFKFPTPTTHQQTSNHSDVLFTNTLFPIEIHETKRGKLRNFFLPKLSSTTSSQQLMYTSNNVTANFREYNENASTHLIIKNNFYNGSEDNFEQVVNNVAEVHKTEADNMSTTKFTVQVIFPSMKFDLGLCSGEPKDVKESSKQMSLKNHSLPFSKSNLTPESQTKYSVTTINILQKLKLKGLTFNIFKQTSQNSYLSSSLNNISTIGEEGRDYFTPMLPQSSTEITLDSATGTTYSNTFCPYTKFQVKDLFNFKVRPTSVLTDSKLTHVKNITETLKSFTRSLISSKVPTKSALDNNGGENIRSKQTSHLHKHLLTTTQSENEEDYLSGIFNVTPCECLLDNDMFSNKESSVETIPSELGVTEGLSPEVETVTSHSFINLKNLFDRKKLNNNSNLNMKKMINTEWFPKKNINRPQTLSNNIYKDLASSHNSDLLFSDFPQEKNKLQNNISSKKSATFTTSNTGFQPTSFPGITSSVNYGKKLQTESSLLRNRDEAYKSTKTKKDFFNLRSVINLKKKNKLEPSPNNNYIDSEDEYVFSEYPSSTTVNIFESPVQPFSNASESLVDMNPEEFFQEFEKRTKTMLHSSTMLVKKQKLSFKHVLKLMKQTSRPQTTNESLMLNDQTNSQNITAPIQLYTLKNAKAEVEEEYGYYEPTKKSSFDFKNTVNTTKTFVSTKLEYSSKSKQRSSSELPHLHTKVRVAFRNTVDKPSTLDHSLYNYSDITPQEDWIAKKMFKLKSALSLHKPVSSNNTKLCHIFDPGGLLSSKEVILQEQTLDMESLNDLEQRTNSSTKEYSTENLQNLVVETVNTEYSTKPVGWWLFWNQPKVTFYKFLFSNKSRNVFIGTTTNNDFRWHSTHPLILQKTTLSPTEVYDSSWLYNTRSTQLFLQDIDGKGTGNMDLKKIQTSPLDLRTSIPAMLNSSFSVLPTVFKNKHVVHDQVNISISKFDVTKTKYNRTRLYSGSNTNIHSSVNVIGLNKENKIYKPFERVLNTTNPLRQENINVFDAKNLSYFIQNLTHYSNNTLLDNSKPLILNSNITKESFKLDLLNETSHANANNTTSMNDSSFSIMAYVMRPFESLISVFKGKSTQNMTKVGDVNASDIHNGSIPSHLHPQNSSLVILALNNTNTTSKETHESSKSRTQQCYHYCMLVLSDLV